MALMAFLAEVDWTDDRQAVDAWVREDTDLLGSGDTPDPVATRAIVTEVVRNARSVPSHRLNHPVAVAMTPRWRERLKDIRVPTLVFHGTDDFCFPLDHGRTLAEEIPGARLIVVEGMGHVLAPGSRYWPVFADALIEHTAMTMPPQVTLLAGGQAGAGPVAGAAGASAADREQGAPTLPTPRAARGLTGFADSATAVLARSRETLN